MKRRCSLLLAVALLSVAGCSSPAPTRPSAGTRELHEKLLVEYTERHIETKNIDDALRFVSLIPTDSKYADKVPDLKRRIDQMIDENDASVASLYNDRDKVPIELQAVIEPRDADQIFVTGKAKLPRDARLIVSVWREDLSGWQILDEQMVEIGPGSKFQAVLSAYSQSKEDKDAVEKALTGNFELRIAGCFGPADQPEKVLKLAGLKGQKLAGDWVETSGADGNCVRYHQRYSWKTKYISPQCIDIKATKI